MNKTLYHFLILLTLTFFVACRTDDVVEETAEATSFPQPTATTTIEPTTTNEPSPTEIPPLEIIPEPMPTTYPNQEAIIAEEGEVDFVIDWAALNQPPISLLSSENWYKYTSPDGTFSVIMRGIWIIKEEEHTIEFEPGNFRDVQIVRSDTYINQFSITYFDLPDLASGEITSQEFLDSIDFEFLLTLEGNPTIVEQNDIQQGGFPGRDYVIETTFENLEDPLFLRVRIYIVEDRIYQLTVGGLFTEQMFGEHGSRFLDSFTIHSP